MGAPDFNLVRFVSRLLPSAPRGDQANDATAPRGSPYSEVGILNPVVTKHLFADEGSYLLATNPTPGTAIAGPVLAAFADTTPFIYIANQHASKNFWLDYLKLIIAVAPASSVQAYLAVVIDTAVRALTTDNTVAPTVVCPNSAAPNPGSSVLVKVQSGATASVIAASSSAKRVVARGAFGGLPIVGDELVATFGAADPGPYQGLTAAQATCPGRKVTNCAPVIVGPGHNATVHLWFPSNATTGLSFEYELGGVLR